MKHLGFNFKKKEHGVIELKTKKPVTVLAIPDLHFPFAHPDALLFLHDIAGEMKPDIVVCLGDEVDFAALSFHDKDVEMPGACDEYIHALEGLGELYKIFPNVLCCHSNHTSRPFRLAHKAGLPSQMMRSYKEFLQAPDGWTWHDRIVINDTCYIHGDPKSGRNAAWSWMNEHRMSTVIGHIHGHGGVQYSASPFRTTFAANAGCLIDPSAMAFRYGNKYANKATLGCVVVKNSTHAHFIPMETK
jgi:hypothetical protein